MLLCFWLVILFLDWAFSTHRIVVSEDIPSVEIPTPVVTTIVQEPIQDTIHTVAPVQEVNEMVSGVVHQELGDSEIFQDLNVLEYLYTKNKNPQFLQPLVEKFLQYYQFDKANTYLSLLVAEQWNYFHLNLDPHQVVYTLFHNPSLDLASANSLDNVFSLINDYQSHHLLTDDDVMFYKWLHSLWVYDYATATAAFGKVTGQRYQDFKKSYDSALANYMKIKNPPPYYRDGLVALTLLKNWYFSFAKRIALHSLNQNQQYILPYQVLAYTNFLMHNWESAKDYFLKLADFDTNNVFLYKFLIGICYYWYGDYEQSIIYLNQVADPALRTDVYRYMLLSYIHLEDMDNMVRIRHNLLGESSLQPSDFSLFFDHMFFIPFRTWKPFLLYSDNPQLADLYLWKCSTLLSGSQADVCVYGEVWLQLAKQNLSSVGQKLISLSQTYHQSHLYHLLGDYYLLNHDYSLAKDTYIKALSICDDTSEQKILTAKIDQLPQ